MLPLPYKTIFKVTCYYSIIYQTNINMARGTKVERREINSSQPYEVKYEAEKLGVSVQQITGAKRATGSNDRKVIEEYIKNKK